MTLQFKNIPLKSILAHPNNVRTELGDVQELIDSIKAKGVLQALTVTPHATVKGGYLLIAGHRRLAAARLAKLTSVPCVVSPDLSGEAEQLEAMLVENLQRVDISPIEEARAYQHLLDLPDYDVARLAKSTGRSQRLVKERVKLSRLNEGQAAGVHEGTLTIERALVLVEFADDPAAVEQLEQVPARDQSTWEVKVKALQRAREWKAGLPKLRQDLEAAGITLIDAPAGPYWQWKDYRVCSYQDPSTPEEALADGWDHAVVDAETPHPYRGLGTVIYVKERTAPVAHVPPEPSPEEAADAKRRQDINAGLEIAAEVREAHLLERIRKATAEVARTALCDVVAREVDPRRIAWALGVAWSEDLDEQDVLDGLPQLTVEQLALLIHFDQSEREGTLRRLSGWNMRDPYAREVASPWLDDLKNLYGYQLSDVEKQALDYFREPEEDNDDDECPVCDDPEVDDDADEA